LASASVHPESWLCAAKLSPHKADGLPQHPAAGPQDVERDQRRHERVEAQPARDRRQREADQHRARGPHVRHDVPAAADQHQRPDQVSLARLDPDQS
jgi:hypothetical protein